MATEDEILKTLRSIERILSSNTVAGGLGRAPVAPRGAGTQGRQQGNVDPTQTVAARRSYQATTAAMNTLNESARTLNRSFSGLNRTVLNTRANFIEMNRSMRAYTRSAPTANVTGGQERVPEGADATGGIVRTLERAISSIIPRRARPGAGPGVGPTPPQPPTPTPPAQPPLDSRGAGQPLRRYLQDVFGGPASPGGRLGGEIGRLGGRINYVGLSLTSFFIELSGAVQPLVRDVLALHSAGIQASSALGGLYIDAARAGMSLAEYTKVLQEASPAVTRAGSMDEFDKTLDVTRERLANLGIFGEEATKLSASLANSATVLGIPQERLADATNAQIATFERLRKSSLLTADQFQQLTAQLAQQQEVQSNLLGLSGPQRAARLAELTELKTFGLSLGASKEASDAFGDALIKQRNLTAPKRFEAAGRIRQAGAMFGMGAGDTEELARLSRRKNLTGEDRETALRLGSQLQSRIEEYANSGNVYQENQAEQMQAALDSSGIGNLLKAAGNLQLSADSGQAGVNKDFAKGTSDLLKFTGEMAALLKGVAANDVIQAISSALGSAAFALGLGAILSRVLTRSPLFTGGRRGGRGDANPVDTDPLGGGPGTGGRGRRGILGRIGAIFGNVAGGPATGGGTGGVECCCDENDPRRRARVNRPERPDRRPTPEGTTPGRPRGRMGRFGRIGAVLTSALGLAVDTAVDEVDVGDVADVAETAGSRASGTMGRALKVALKGTALIGAVVSGIAELFTGDVQSALTDVSTNSWFGDGVTGFVKTAYEKLQGIGFAAARGLLAGFTGLGDWVIEGLTSVWNNTIGELFTGMKVTFGWSLTNMLDQLLTWVTIKSKQAQLFVAKSLSFLPGMNSWAEGIQADITVAEKTMSELKTNGKSTLTDIGTTNKKILDEQKKSSALIFSSTQGLTSKLIAQAQGIRGPADEAAKNAEKAKDATAVVSNAMVAIPGQVTRTGVTDPTVNTPTTAAPPPAPVPTTGDEAATTPTITDLLLAQFGTMNQLLSQILTAEQLQAAGLEGLGRSLGRPTFSNSEDLFSILNRT